jgi:hypothetical protein
MSERAIVADFKNYYNNFYYFMTIFSWLPYFSAYQDYRKIISGHAILSGQNT